MALDAIIIASFISITVFTAYMAINAYFEKQRAYKELRSRLSGGQDGNYYDLNEEAEAESYAILGEKTAFAKALEAVLRVVGVNVDEATEQLSERFINAGIYNADAPVYYLFFQRILSIVLVVTGIMIILKGSEADDGALEKIMIGVIVSVIGAFGPKLYLQNAISNRKKVLTRSFPDTLDLLLVCIESGLALDAALTRVCRELGGAYPEMTQELNRTRLELTVLSDRTKALQNLAERTDLISIRSLVATLIQSEKFGVSLGESLRVLSEDYRLERLTLAEQKAGRLPALITIPLIFMMLPAFGIIIIGPAILRVMAQGGIFGN